jgi:hypothetical protein
LRTFFPKTVRDLVATHLELLGASREAEGLDVRVLLVQPQVLHATVGGGFVVSADLEARLAIKDGRRHHTRSVILLVLGVLETGISLLGRLPLGRGWEWADGFQARCSLNQDPVRVNATEP